MLVMVTRVEGVEGFLALLHEMIWRVKFTYALEYVVYARKVRPYLVNFLATVDVRARIIEGGANPHYSEAVGTSEEMAV